MENKAKGPIAPAPHASSLLPSLKAPQASERTAASFIKCPLTAAESRRRAPRGCRKGAGIFWTNKTRKKKKKVVLNSKNEEYKQAQSSSSHKTVTQKLNGLKLLLVQKQKHHKQHIVDTKN